MCIQLIGQYKTSLSLLHPIDIRQFIRQYAVNCPGLVSDLIKSGSEKIG
jgi:hypothetical protein